MSTTTQSPETLKLMSPEELLAALTERGRLKEEKKNQKQKAQLPRLAQKILQHCAKTIRKISRSSNLKIFKLSTIVCVDEFIPNILQSVKELTLENQGELFALINNKLKENGWYIVDDDKKGKGIVFPNENESFEIGVLLKEGKILE
jgi:succinylglutamate desuccinylase